MTCRKTWRTIAVSLASAVVLTGCEFSVYEVPLPGGPDVGEDPLEVTVVFDDVLDLVPQSSVKVNDITVGQVSDITLDGYDARVDLELKNDVTLPANAVAELRQTSLLGEKFVSLESPEDPSEQQLEDGDVIPLERSGRNPEVEEVLGALSLLLNGGGVAQLKTINRELGDVLEGREGAARSVLRQIEEFMGQLDTSKDDIVEAIESLNRLALSIERELPTIDKALAELPSALDSIDRQRDDLVRMLRALNDLSDVAVDVIRASKASTINSLEQLAPVLTQLAAAGDDFTKAFHVFLTYPFVDEVVGRDPQVARNLHMGDYTNLSVQLDVDLENNDGGSLPDLPTPDLPDEIDPGEVLDDVTRCLRSGDLSSRACQEVLDRPRALLELQETCDKRRNRDKDVCRQLRDLLGGGGLPQLPGLPGLPDLGDLGGLGSSLGLGRAGSAVRDPRGPTYGQLMDVFDPTLVRLLVPGMVLK